MIALFLPLSTQARLLRTCKHTFYVISRIIYKDIDIAGHRARLLWMTLIPRKFRYFRYVELIQTLVFTGSGLDDLHLTYPIFTDALQEMFRLKSLQIAIPQLHTSCVLNHLKSKGIIRAAISPFLCLAEITSQDEHPICSRHTLPLLRSLSIFGDSKLLALASFRNITQVYLGLPISITTFSQVTDDLCSGRTAIPLQHFTITLTSRAAFESTAVLISLGMCCHDLRTLTLDIPSGCVNALNVSRFLSSRPVVFPNLESLVINEKETKPAYFVTPRLVSLAIQREEVKISGRMRPRLHIVRIGPIEWARLAVDYGNREWWVDDFTDESAKTVADLPVASLLDSIGCFFENTAGYFIPYYGVSRKGSEYRSKSDMDSIFVLSRLLRWDRSKSQVIVSICPPGETSRAIVVRVLHALASTVFFQAVVPRDSDALAVTTFIINTTCQRKAWPIHRLYCTTETVPPNTELGQAWVRHNVNEIVDYSMGLWGVNLMAEQLDNTALMSYIREKARQTLPAFTLTMVQAPPDSPPYMKVILEPSSLVNSHVESRDIPFLSSSLTSQLDLEGVFLVNVGFKIFSYDRSTAPVTEFMEIHIATDSIFDNIPVPEPTHQVSRWVRKMHLERFGANGNIAGGQEAA
ncbi:hypothetical protein GALMADRAFT_143446 [Galerina marginata CBS 339.88]|uniref:Uncharacterized protein n=1 Tax=Galerina marginata (strain CBS 339.88) TaxID=685588 RepID=A0A067SZC3_GALM3|nr:hypothetical protein GALMADRAFT_143446 [Galerina marginata CBS 339.88]